MLRGLPRHRDQALDPFTQQVNEHDRNTQDEVSVRVDPDDHQQGHCETDPPASLSVTEPLEQMEPDRHEENGDNLGTHVESLVARNGGQEDRKQPDDVGLTSVACQEHKKVRQHHDRCLVENRSLEPRKLVAQIREHLEKPLVIDPRYRDVHPLYARLAESGNLLRFEARAFLDNDVLVRVNSVLDESFERGLNLELDLVERDPGLLQLGLALGVKRDARRDDKASRSVQDGPADRKVRFRFLQRHLTVLGVAERLVVGDAALLPRQPAAGQVRPDVVRIERMYREERDHQSHKHDERRSDELSATLMQQPLHRLCFRGPAVGMLVVDSFSRHVP